MKKIAIYIGMFCLTFFSNHLFAQKTISGIVTEASTDGQPLPGVSVILKENTAVGTVTDIDGKFALTIPREGQNLIFSFVGFSDKEVAIGEKNNFNIQLGESAEILDEIVVSAIGIEKDKKALGHAVQKVDGELLVDARETNLVNALSAKVAGVQVTSTSGSPGASANIVIRGRASINNNSPLFVIDGVPIDNSYAGSNFVDHSNRAIDLNPDDIENLTVLKGPSATALYGVRAANGAIIITTKRGKAGKGKITVSQSLTFDRVNKLPEQQQLFAQGEAINGVAVYREPLTSNRNWGPRLDTLRYDGNADYQFDKNGKIVGISSPDATENRVVPYDNVDDFFQTGITSNTHLSVSGGNEKTTYYMSGGYLSQSGVIPNATYERLTLKLSGSTKLNDKLKVSGTANYINSGGDRQQRGSNLSGVMLGLMRAPVTFDLANGLDNPVDNAAAYQFADGSQRTYWGAYDNPYWSVNKNLSRDKVNRIIGQAEVNYQIAPFLSAIYRIGTDYYFEERKTFWDNNSNEFGTGVIFGDLYSYRSLNSDFLLSLDKKLYPDFGIKASIGHNFFSERSLNNITEGETFVIPNFYDISNVAQVTFTDDFLRERKIVGTFYDIGFNFKNYLYLNTTGRWDWSSTLPTTEVPFFYDSYSLSFVFTEPLGLSTNKTFSYGKIRLAYATVGGDASPYSLNTFFSATNNVKGQTAFLQQSTIGNGELRPEQTRSLEAGLDIRFFQNRLGLDLTVYQSKSKDQIIQVPIPFASGFSLATANAGEIENKGIEILLNATPVKLKKMIWEVTVNFSANENTVTKLAEGVNDIRFAGAGVTSTSNRAIPNQPYGVLYGTRWLRNEQNEILVDDEGYPLFDPQNPGIIGDPNPDWQMGINNRLTFGNFSFSTLIDIRQGGDIFNGTVGAMKNLGIHKSTENREEEIIFDGVRESDGGQNTTPIQLNSAFYSRYPFAGVSEAGIEDGSWIRLRELTLNYAFPKSKLGGLPFESLEIGLSARNVFLITDYSGVDPETNLAGAGNSFGRDWFNSPNTQSFGVNVKVQL